MSMRRIFDRYLKSSELELAENEVLILTVRFILKVARYDHVGPIHQVPWDNPRLQAYEDAPSIVFGKLLRLRNKGRLEVPVAPQVLVSQAMSESAKKWRRKNKYSKDSVSFEEGRREQELRAIADVLMDSAWSDLENRELFERFLRDLTEYISEWKQRDQMLTYFCLPWIHSGMARLVVQYGTLSISEIAERTGRTEQEVYALLAMDGSLASRIAQQTDVSRKSVESRCSRLAKGLCLFARTLPYLADLCKSISGR